MISIDRKQRALFPQLYENNRGIHHNRVLQPPMMTSCGTVPSFSLNDVPMGPLGKASFSGTGNSISKPRQSDTPDYTSASTGKFSDCIFHLPDSTSSPRGSTSSSSSFSSSSSSSSSSIPLASPVSVGFATTEVPRAVRRKSDLALGSSPLKAQPSTRARSSSHLLPAPNTISQSAPYNKSFTLSSSALPIRHKKNLSTASAIELTAQDGKRLVHQFLKDPSQKDGELEKEDLFKDGLLIRPLTRSSSSLSSPMRNSLPRVFYYDLKRTLTSVSTTSVNEPLCEKTPDYNRVDYKEYIVNEIDKFECIIKNTVTDVLCTKEKYMEHSFQALSTLEKELRRIRTRIVELHYEVKENYLVELETHFNATDSESFISQLDEIIQEHLSSLEKLEVRIKNSKDVLAKQKNALEDMESIVKLKQLVADSKKNMTFSDRLKEYKGIIWDFLAIIIIAILIWILRRYFSKS